MISGSNAGTTTLAALSVTGQLDAGNVLVDTTTTLTGIVNAPAANTIAGTLATVTTVGALGTGAVTAASIADGAIDLATFAADCKTGSALKADIVSISADTTAADNLEAACDGGTYNVGGGAVVAASVTGAVGSVTGAVGSLGAQAKLDVNAEIVDTLVTDTYVEPVQGAPLATTSLSAKLNYLYKAWRNKHTQTATEYKLYADGGVTVDQKATVTDDTTTFTRSVIATGP